MIRIIRAGRCVLISIPVETKQPRMRQSIPGHQRTIKILGPRIIVTVQIVLKKRWRGPDENGCEDCGITFRSARAGAHTDNLPGGIQLVHRYSFFVALFARLRARNPSKSGLEGEHNYDDYQSNHNIPGCRLLFRYCQFCFSQRESTSQRESWSWD